MATPARTSILLDIKSTLEGITVANGYNFDVANVEPWLRPAKDVPAGERPYLGFGLDLESYEHQSFDYMFIKVPWLVVGYLPPYDSWTEMSAAVNLLIDDIIAAVMADDTLGGTCIGTLCLRSETSEADPQWQEGGWCFVDFETRYERTTSAS